jgi:hypothetical protein
MDFLFSNLPPVRTSCPKFADTFYSLIPEASRLDIVVGYVTADSLAELQQTVAQNDNIAMLNLIIGMHYWDKFTKLQYNAAVALNEFLRGKQRGEVRLVTPFRFHGKLYLYSNTNGAFAGIIGSNNLGSIVDGRTRIYEASALFRERQLAVKMREFIDKLTIDATDNIADCTITEFEERNTLLENHENVKKILPDEQAGILSSLTNTRFEIPLVKNGDVPKKSNLNVFFGKGRLIRTTGVVQPRHWYEAELIVPSTITEQLGYPQKNTPAAIFTVITDDGWQFSCKVSGDYSKNFRSEDDLKILGKWIKGRLENAGVLEVGHQVTPDTFMQYGRDSFTLTKTNKTIIENGRTRNLWYLDFGVQ